MGYGGAVVLFAMMMITVADVFMRQAFNRPIPGVTEVTPLMLVIIAGLGLGWCALRREHVKVDLLTNRMPAKMRFISLNLMMIITLVVYGIMTYYTLFEALETSQFSSILKIPMAPFLWTFWAGLVIFCICILIILIEDFRNGVKHGS
jgi:TRAP-type C4-dicarboxylate transport system permease small subunit